MMYRTQPPKSDTARTPPTTVRVYRLDVDQTVYALGTGAVLTLLVALAWVFAGYASWVARAVKLAVAVDLVCAVIVYLGVRAHTFEARPPGNDCGGA